MFQSPAVVPAMMSELGDTMAFFERVWNTILYIAEKLVIFHQFSVVDFYIQVRYLKLKK